MVFLARNAGVAELADAHDSKSCGATRAGSSPATGIYIDIAIDTFVSIAIFFLKKDTSFLLYKTLREDAHAAPYVILMTLLAYEPQDNPKMMYIQVFFFVQSY